MVKKSKGGFYAVRRGRTPMQPELTVVGAREPRRLGAPRRAAKGEEAPRDAVAALEAPSCVVEADGARLRLGAVEVFLGASVKQ